MRFFYDLSIIFLNRSIAVLTKIILIYSQEYLIIYPPDGSLNKSHRGDFLTPYFNVL